MSGRSNIDCLSVRLRQTANPFWVPLEINRGGDGMAMDGDGNLESLGNDALVPQGERLEVQGEVITQPAQRHLDDG